MAEKKEISAKKEIDVHDLTSCDATAQMLIKARRDGVETAFDRAANMKACPIGADSACCKHCFMGPCRLNSKDPYSKVGVCGATIDTIMSRNFARAVAAGSAAHTDHGMGMLDLFREVLDGKIKDYRIKNPQKLIEVAQSIDIETEGREIKDIAMDPYMSSNAPTPRSKAKSPLPNGCRKRPWKPGARRALFPAAPCARLWN